MTFLDMQTRVGELINQSVTDDTGEITLTEVKANLNRGYQKVVNRVANLGQDYYMRLSKADLVGGQNLYGLPTDLRKLVRLDLGFESSGVLYKATKLDTNAFGDPATTYTSPMNPVYAVRGNNIEIYPTPTQNVTNGLVFRYIESVADLSDDSDVPDLPPEFDDLPIEYAVSRAKLHQGLVDEAEAMLSEFKAELNEMTADTVSRSLDDNDRVIIRDEY